MTHNNTVFCQKIRDLSLVTVGDQQLVFACDSSGSVGALPEDDFYTPSERSGLFMVKVVLMETFACGAVPLAVYADFCYGDCDYTRDCVRGAKGEAAAAGVDPNMVFPFYGTAKDPLCSTTGAVVVGKVGEKGLQIAVSHPDDLVCVIGRPKDKDSFEKQLSTASAYKLRMAPFVKEMVPCGSHGVRYEATQLAQTNGLEFAEYTTHPLDDQMENSCGACACAVFTVGAEDYHRLQELDLPHPINCIGTLKGEKISAEPNIGSPGDVSVNDDGAINIQNGTIVTTHKLSYAVGKRAKDVEEGDPASLAAEMFAQGIRALEGAKPFLVINNLNLPMEPEGKQTINALTPLIRELGLDTKTQFTGSTEDNHPAPQTGIAIRIFGYKEERSEL